MKIEPASLSQVRIGKDGRKILIEEDVLNIAKELKTIDDSLCLRWNERGEYYVVYQLVGDTEKLVLTAQELDERILTRVRKIAHPSYNFVAELEHKDDRAQMEKDHRFREQTGEVGERLAYTLRKDLQHTGKAFIPKDI